MYEKFANFWPPTYVLPLFTLVDIWTTTYRPHLVNVVWERPLSLWFLLIKKSLWLLYSSRKFSMQTLMFFDMIKPRRKEYLPCRYILLSDHVFSSVFLWLFLSLSYTHNYRLKPPQPLSLTTPLLSNHIWKFLEAASIAIFSFTVIHSTEA